jgi:hypothetical protein
MSGSSLKIAWVGLTGTPWVGEGETAKVAELG